MHVPDRDGQETRPLVDDRPCLLCCLLCIVCPLICPTYRLPQYPPLRSVFTKQQRQQQQHISNNKQQTRQHDNTTNMLALRMRTGLPCHHPTSPSSSSSPSSVPFILAHSHHPNPKPPNTGQRSKTLVTWTVPGLGTLLHSCTPASPRGRASIADCTAWLGAVLHTGASLTTSAPPCDGTGPRVALRHSIEWKVACHGNKVRRPREDTEGKVG
jgi:hypothetical protein